MSTITNNRPDAATIQLLNDRLALLQTRIEHTLELLPVLNHPTMSIPDFFEGVFISISDLDHGLRRMTAWN